MLYRYVLRLSSDSKVYTDVSQTINHGVSSNYISSNMFIDKNRRKKIKKIKDMTREKKRKEKWNTKTKCDTIGR